MHPRVDALPPPSPDYNRFLAVLRRERPDRVPLIELAIHPDVVNELLGDEAGDTCQAPGDSAASPAATHLTPATGHLSPTLRALRLHHRLGYDVMKISATIPFQIQRLTGNDPGQLSSAARSWTDEHAGPVASFADLEAYPWPTPESTDFGPVTAATVHLPPDMRLVGFSGGVLEFAMDLLGMQNLFIATRRQPDLVTAVLDRVGRLILGVFERYCAYDSVCALWLGDDLGHKHGTLLHPDWLTRHILPWYRRFADLAHAHNRPFILHTCGDTRALMPALVDTGIDAKHSFEDGIAPVEQWYDAWHDRIAILGGVDVHLLATGAPDQIRARTRAILSHCAAHGGYALGSGNSIPNYVPALNYLAMIETAR